MTVPAETMSKVSPHRGFQFSKLLEPCRIAHLILRNRLVMPAMVARYGSPGGFVSERMKNYYEARAKGGVGLIVVEATCVHPGGLIRPNQLGIWDDKFIPGLGELAKVIQRNGAKACLQLHHAGRLALPELSGTQPLAPSAIPMSHFALGLEGALPRELAVEEIAELTALFAQAAERAKRAGFDAVELHGASGYLFAQFLSRAANHRQDAYGNSLQNRARFLVETLRAIRNLVGREYPVWFRINGQEYGVQNGITLEEAKETARMTEAAGANAVHVTATGPQSPITVGAQPLVPGLNVDLAGEIKKGVNFPVIAVGFITPEIGEKAVAEGKADLIAMGKALIADPELPNKLASGSLDDIRPCLVCMACPYDPKTEGDSGMQCQINAAAGREGEFTIKPATKSKRILVIGAGPAGMEAGRVASLRGHEVFLYERQTEVGGHLIEAAASLRKERIRYFIQYLERQITKLGVKIQMGKEVTPRIVEEMKPDAVIIATGALPVIPDLPGSDANNVVTALDVLRRRKETGNRVVVVGGGLIGCEAAEFLADQGKRVTILEMLDRIGSDIGTIMGPVIIWRLKDLGVKMEAGVRAVAINEKGVNGMQGESARFYPADTVVFATGLKPDRKIADTLPKAGPTIYMIGDCLKPRRIKEAILEGADIARLL